MTSRLSFGLVVALLVAAWATAVVTVAAAGERTVDFEVKEVSQLPNPKESDYSEALFAIKAECTTAEGGESFEAMVYVWAFKKRMLSKAAYLQPGNSGRLKIAELKDRPAIQTVQKVDTINDFELPVYFGEMLSSDIDLSKALRPALIERLEEPRLDEKKRMAMIDGMARSLAERDITLVVVPIPFKEEIVGGNEIRPGSKSILEQRARMVKELRAAGIHSLDVADELKAAAADGKRLYYPDVEEHHPSDLGVQMIAKAIGEYLTEQGLVSKGAAFAGGPLRLNFVANKLGAGYGSTQVLTAESQPVTLDQPAPLLMLGDSYTRYPRRTARFGSVDSANIAAHLCFQIGIPCRNFTVSSGCPVMAKLVRENQEILEGVKVAVFVVSPYHPWRALEGMWEHAPF